MTGPEDDGGARVRGIFEQLRTDQGDPPPGTPRAESRPDSEVPEWNEHQVAQPHQEHQENHAHPDPPEPGEPDAGNAEAPESHGEPGKHHENHDHHVHHDHHGRDGDPGAIHEPGPETSEHQEFEEDQGPAARHGDPAAQPHDGQTLWSDAGTPEAGDGDQGHADGGEDSGAEAVIEEAGGLAPRELPRILAVANQKGGVGKTTTAVNLGAALAELGYRVLVVDLDPQGNATTGLGVNTRNLEHSVYDVILHDVPIEDCIEATSLRNLFVVPATIDLAGAEIELVPAFSREQRLRRALESVGDDFDFTVIDCPPSLGLLTVNGLTAATEVLVPIQCEYYALEGLGQLLRNVNLVQGNLNPRLELSTIILTMYDARTKLAEQVANEVREHFGDKVCRTMVPRTVRLSEAPSFGQPVILFDPTSRGAIAYRELAKEVSRGAPQRAR